ncbi:MAG: hypothetical protein KC912_17185 [Proteobacteria bacterium]|nr:hypothetical protein [Pseudomonadota bacterium]
MDAVVVGILTGGTVGIGTVFWYLLVSPESVVSIFGDVSDDWFDDDGGGSVSALVWVTGLAVFLCSFVTGVSVAFLASTL